MNVRVGLFAAIVAVFVSSVPGSALDLNGFAPRRGEGAFALSYTAEGWDEFWVGKTKVSDPGVGEADIASSSLWGRYGLTDRLALVGNLAYVDADSDGLAGFSQSSLQDLSVIAQLTLVERGGALRQRLLAGLGTRFAVGDYDENLPIDVGDGTTDVLTRLVWQLEGGRFYLSQQVGFDLRGGDAPDQFPFYTEVGFYAGKVTLIGFYQRLVADGGTDIGDPGFTFPSNKEEFQRLGGRIFVRFDRGFGISAGVFTTLDGRNTSDTTGFFFGGVIELGPRS